MNTRFTAPLQARRGDPRGQVLVLFALMLVVLLLVSALAVDYGGWLVAKRNYQNVSDAAALAGAQELTRLAPVSKNQRARQDAWASVKAALNVALDPATLSQESRDESLAVSAGGYNIWVASPPTDAGAAYLGKVGGPGNVYVRIEHPGQTFLSNIAGISRTVTAWATAGRFPANYALIAMCSPTSVTSNCLAGDANIKLDGSNTNLIVNTGDLGTNRWVKTGGNANGLALGANSNAYMQLFDTCWGNSSNQCQLWGYTDPNVDYSTIRAAVPLGAPIQDPAYTAPTINATTTPNQCRGTLSPVQLASVDVLERNVPATVADLPISLAAAREPIGPRAIVAAAPKIGGTVYDTSSNKLAGATVTVIAGPSNVNLVATSGSNGSYSLSLSGAGDYTIQATYTNYASQQFVVTVGANGIVTQDFTLAPNPGTIQGFVTQGGVGMGGVLVTSTSGGSATSVAGTGGYVISNVAPGTWTVTATLAGYASTPASASITVTAGSIKSQNFSMAAVVAGGISGTVTDQVTGLVIRGVTMTLNTGAFVTTNSAGTYSFSNLAPGSYTVSASAASGGYMTASPSNPVSPASVTVSSGATTTRDFALWPKGCGTANSDKGNWDCGLPSGPHCPATLKPTAADVSCVFTQDNAIRPGTYHDIHIDGCAWLDSRGGDPLGSGTGLAAGQSAGIYYITGTISLEANSFLFGDGVTIVMKTGSGTDFKSGAGFVLNYGTHKVSATPGVCDKTTDLTIPYAYGDTGEKCFRTVSGSGTQDYAYGAWGTKLAAPWSSATFPTYNDGLVQKGQELGITFYLNGSGLGNASRFKDAGQSMGYLFNGVLYGPNDDIQIGGGSDAQTAAGQIVGWTIEYHGGTRIQQNWYGDPADGQPFLIEPILGQ